MAINADEMYINGDYSYKNYLSLSKEELLMILHWRNHPSIRSKMNNTSEISVKSHLQYVENLKDRTDAVYWLVLYKDIPIGTLNIIDIDWENKICEPGFYLSPEVMGKGESIFFLYNYKSFLLNVIGFEKLIGHNYLDNLSALQFTIFFGADITDVTEVNNRLNVSSCLVKESFNQLTSQRLISKYMKFLKTWNINDILGKYEVFKKYAEE